MEVSITEKLDEYKNCKSLDWFSLPNINYHYSVGRELGKYAVWSLSSAKPGNGIEQLRDDPTETYWQSDGTVDNK